MSIYLSYSEDLSRDYGVDGVTIEISAKMLALIFILGTYMDSPEFWQDWDTSQDDIQAMLAALIKAGTDVI